MLHNFNSWIKFLFLLFLPHFLPHSFKHIVNGYVTFYLIKLLALQSHCRLNIQFFAFNFNFTEIFETICSLISKRIITLSSENNYNIHLIHFKSQFSLLFCFIYSIYKHQYGPYPVSPASRILLIRFQRLAHLNLHVPFWAARSSLDLNSRTSPWSGH